MREIKFRMWDKNRKYMITWAAAVPRYVSCNGSVISITEGTCVSGHAPDVRSEPDVEIMQFTGLHDKNGTPVYESDIINEGSSIGVVGWCDVYHRWEYKTQTSSAGLYLFNGEVIGNIYQHPELINRR